MRTMLDFAASCAATPDALQKAQLKGVRKAALFVTKTIRLEIRNATGGDSRLSGVGKNGARVGARYDVKGKVNPTAIINATGQLHFIEHDMKPHDITPKKRSGKKAVRTPYGAYRKVQHPGTKAKRPFAKGVQKAAPKTTDIFNEEIVKAMAKLYGPGAAI